MPEFDLACHKTPVKITRGSFPFMETELFIMPSTLLDAKTPTPAFTIRDEQAYRQIIL
jgi:hypothetical protein